MRGTIAFALVVGIWLSVSFCAALRADESFSTKEAWWFLPVENEVKRGHNPSIAFNSSVFPERVQEIESQHRAIGALEHVHGDDGTWLAATPALAPRTESNHSFAFQSCSCVALGPILLVSHRGEYLQIESKHRLQMTASRENAGALWNIVDVGEGKVVLRNGLNLTLQDAPIPEREFRKERVKSLLADHVDQPGLWEYWNLLSESTGGQDCSEVIITSHQNRYLQDNQGVPLLSGNPGAWERWKLTSPSGGSPCGASFIEQTKEEVHLQDCPIFYQTAEGVDMNQSTLRHSNVRNMMSNYSNIRNMTSIYYTRDWGLITSMFKTLHLPVNLSTMGSCKACTKRHSKGHLAKWATLILGAAWQLRFQQPCMALLEDDVMLPETFWKRMATLAPQLKTNAPLMLKFGEFGEGYLFNLKAADMFLRRVYEVGINDHSDTWTDTNMRDHIHEVDVGAGLTVETGAGNIWYTPEAAQSDFEYNISHDYSDLQILTRAFDAPDEFAHNVDLVATASRVANPSKVAHATSLR